MPGLLSFSNDLQCQFHLYKWFISAFSKHRNHRYDPEQLTQYIKIKSSLSSVVLSNLLSLKKKKKKDLIEPFFGSHNSSAQFRWEKNKFLEEI